jgi:hypothetical protein
MQLQFVITTSLDEKIDEKWAYVIHYCWRPSMANN